MAYCTLVEFEWTSPDQRDAFERLTGGDEGPVEGRLIRVLSIDDAGARAIEVWAAPDDARRHAERTAPDLGASELPAPTRVVGFEVTHLAIA